MRKLITNLVALGVICFGVSKIIDLQYSQTYYRTSYNKLSVAEQYRQLDCLTESIYYEATGEPLEGMLAVAQVMVNRSESPKFQDTICKVIHAPSQFSWTREKPKALVKINRNAWNEAREVAKRVLLEGERLRSIEGAMFYHTNAISTNWDKDMIVVARLGNHIFYKEK